MANYALGSPSKGFFVEMLTRDIELNDAILDLLDNCLDGVVRQKKLLGKTASGYYDGYRAVISIDEKSFVIEDNCGGIPRDVAEKYAFRMGRASDQTDDDLPTVGIYGIGMKRAIFKIGHTATVITRHDNKLYQVSIPDNWVASSDEDWDFPIEDLAAEDKLIGGGTKVEISSIRSDIAEKISTNDKKDIFIDLLLKTIRDSYSLIIQKGFEIIINGIKVNPLPMQLLADMKTETPGIRPFLYEQVFSDVGVSVSMAVGFYAPPPSPEDIDDENELRRSSSDAGWTVVCNDRVILYNDKTHLTGWGVSGVPQYHTQFIGIRGIVIFESNNPKNLPMTTTKRGIDTSSKIYTIIRDRMCQGLKMFTDYTNRWKGQNELERQYSSVAKSVSIDTLFGIQSDGQKKPLLTLHASKGGMISNPNLPKPPNDKPYRLIRFTRDAEEIYEVTEYFYKDRDHEVTPSQIGERCFDAILARARNKEG